MVKAEWVGLHLNQKSLELTARRAAVSCVRPRHERCHVCHHIASEIQAKSQLLSQSCLAMMGAGRRPRIWRVSPQIDGAGRELTLKHKRLAG